MKRVIVTGATSMLGVAFINECIKNSVEVLAVVRHGTKRISRLPSSPLVHICEADLSDNMTLKTDYEYDAFYHFAWAHTTKGERNDAMLQYENIASALSAVRLAASLGCKIFVGAGSQAEYGTKNERISPETLPNPDTAYGAAKYAAGKLCNILCEELGMVCVWVRIFSIYGENDNANTLIRYTIEKLRANERPSFSAATQLWDYLYEEDAGRAFYLIGQKCRKSKVYCLGSGRAQPLKSFIETIRDLINPTAELGFGDIESTGKAVSLDADISSLCADTGFAVTVGFEDGIKRILSTL